MWSSSKPNVDLGHHQVFVILTDMSSYADALREAEVSVNCWQGRWGNLATPGCFSLSKSKLGKCDTVIPCNSPPMTWKHVKKQMVLETTCGISSVLHALFTQPLPKQHQQTPTASVDARCLQLEKKCQDEEDTLVTCALAVKIEVGVSKNRGTVHQNGWWK